MIIKENNCYRHLPRILLSFLFITTFLSQAAIAESYPPLEAYGALPSISKMAISPSGNRIGYHRADGDVDAVIVQDLTTGQLVHGTDVSSIKTRYLYFLDEDTLIIFASETSDLNVSRYDYERSAALVLDLKSGNIRQLLRNAKDLHPAQEGLGRVIGASADRSRVYMPAFSRKRSNDAPRFSLFEVPVSDRPARIVESGGVNTIDWFVDGAGNTIVEEQLDNSADEHRIWSNSSGTRELIFKRETSQPLIEVVGMTPPRDALVVRLRKRGDEFEGLYRMRLSDGALGDPIFLREDSSVARPLISLDRVVHGVEFRGFFPEYDFLDPKLTEWVQRIQEGFEGTAVHIAGWTPDFSRLLVRVSGGWNSGAFIIIDRTAPEPELVAYQRPEISSEHVCDTQIIQYDARDGLTIPALLTQCRASEAGNSPLIVMPHGGPQSHDQFGFDWMAQFFASRGYLVLQPQFRGSSGFGATFIQAGYGEWGAKMSTDIDDGVRHLVEQGIADESRVCIVGASYGGYAALAAGAFSPVPYRCVVSIAGVSDLPLMLTDARIDYGSRHWLVAYWQKQIASEDAKKSTLQKISPVEFGENFRAPVLLVHGKDDTVVRIKQSSRMYDALRRADKDVTFVRLNGEDHYLSKGQTRVETLRAVAEFVEANMH